MRLRDLESKFDSPITRDTGSDGEISAIDRDIELVILPVFIKVIFVRRGTTCTSRLYKLECESFKGECV